MSSSPSFTRQRTLTHSCRKKKNYITKQLQHAGMKSSLFECRLFQNPRRCHADMWNEGGSEVTIGPSSKRSLRTSCHRFVKKVCLNTVKDKRDLRDLFTPEACLDKVRFSLGQNRKTLSYSRQWPRTAAGSLTSQHWNPAYSSFRPSTGGVFNLSQDCIGFYNQAAPFTMPWRNQEAAAAAAAAALRAPEEDRGKKNRESHQKHSRC